MRDIPAAEKRGLLERAEKLLAEPGATQRSVAATLGIGQSTLCEWLRAAGVTASGKPDGPDPAGVEREGDHVTITSPAAERPTSPPDQRTGEELLRKHGYDPDEYAITSVRVSEWGNPDSPMFQHRVNATRKDGLLIAPDLGDIEPRPYNPSPSQGEGYRVAFLADPHNPFMDEACFSACLAFLADQKPAQVIHLGDAGNHGHISKHRAHKSYRELTKTTCAAVARYFYDSVEAAPEAEHIFIPGNHDDRIHYYVEDHADELTGFRPPSLPGEEDDQEELVSYNKFYRLETLGVKLIDQDWKLASYPLLRELSARHGHLTGNNAERKLLETHGKSQVHGHLHRGELVYRTKHDPLDIRVAMSCPTLAQVKSDGLGYQPDPDWTPGMAMADVFPDGKFVLSIVPFIEGELLVPGGTTYKGKG